MSESASTQLPRRGPGRPPNSNRDPNGKRMRTAAEGRLCGTVPICFGMYVVEQAADIGVPAPTMVRILLMEAFKARGIVQADLEAKYENNNT